MSARSARSRPPTALLAVEHRIRAACRRVGRREALRTVTWARRLGFISALRAPPDMPPDVDLSERVHRWIRSVLEDAFEHRPAAVPPGFLRDARRRLALCGGRVRVPRAMLPG